MERGRHLIHCRCTLVIQPITYSLRSGLAETWFQTEKDRAGGKKERKRHFCDVMRFLAVFRETRGLFLAA